MLASLSFGKRRRKTSSKKSHNKKPPAKLLKLCKKYRVKATKKVGSRRVYKKVSVLKRQCLKKAKALKKKLMKMHKKSKKTTHRRRSRRRSSEMGEDAFGEGMMFGRRRGRKSHAFGEDAFEEDAFGEDMMFGRRRGRKSHHAFGGDDDDIPLDLPLDESSAMFGFGRYPQFGSVGMMNNKLKPKQRSGGFGRSRFGACVKGVDTKTGKAGCKFGYSRFGNPLKDATAGTLATISNATGNAAAKVAGAGFGKRRRSPKVSKAAAMKAFRAFYKRHCSGNRRMRFGSSNPPLVNSMGYEFCSDGVGGVLGSNSTGLFPSPCVSASSSGADRAKAASAAKGAFGRRRKTKTSGTKGRKSSGTKGKAKSKSKSKSKCYYGRV